MYFRQDYSVKYIKKTVYSKEIKMKIIIDDRETALYPLIKEYLEKNPFSSLSLEPCQALPLGDILFERNGIPILLIERKSFSDLFASIKDGRYTDQSFRLQHDERFANKHDIVYLIEGVYSQLTESQNKKWLISTLTSIQYFKGFGIVRTTNLQDTAETIVLMADKLERDLEKGKKRNNEKQSEVLSTYSHAVKSVKKENISKENIGEIMLSQIPGISTTSAMAIMKLFDGSFVRLLKTLEESPEIISNIRIGDKQRKINSKIVETMKSYFC